MIGMREQRIIWFGIVISTVIYLVLIKILAPGTGEDFDAVASRGPVAMLYGIAVIVFLITWFVVPRLVAGQDARKRMIVQLALFESCAVFGLVGAFLVHDWRIYLAPWALAIAGFIRVLPRETEADRARV
jgi:hypothetical protein